MIKFQVCPEKCTGINLHSHDIIDLGIWRDISSQVKQKHQYTCQCCGIRPYKGAAGEMSEMEAHEVWFFDKENHIQKLTDITCVCKRCHMTIHYRNLLKSQKIDSREAVISKGHYMAVNRCSERSFEYALNEVLAENSRLDRENIEWLLDISYALQQGYFSFREVNWRQLEAVSWGAARLLLPYQAKPVFSLNQLPEECLIDHADKRDLFPEPVPCETCGTPTDTIYYHYDFQINPSTFEMSLAAVRKICPLCRETIYFLAKRWFKKNRKETKHFMQLKQCSYGWFLQYVKAAKDSAKKMRTPMKTDHRRLHIYLRIPYTESYDEYLTNKEFLEKNGAAYDAERGRYRLCPVRNLNKFLPYL